MKLIAVFCLFCLVSMALAEDRPSDTKDSFEFHENGERPLGLHIKGEKGVRHEANEADTPEVNYYIVDKSGKKRSPVVGTFLYREFLTFVWFDQQKFLITINNRHKIFDIYVHARDAKGNFKRLDASIDSDETRKKIFAAASLIKVHPEWKKTGEYPKQAITTHQNLDYEHVVTDDISVGDAFVDIPVAVDPWIIRYRFDADARKFIRMDATLKEKYNAPDFKIPNAQLEKILPKIDLKEGQ